MANKQITLAHYLQVFQALSGKKKKKEPFKFPTVNHHNLIHTVKESCEK